MTAALQVSNAMSTRPKGRPVQIRARMIPGTNAPIVVAALRAPKNNAACRSTKRERDLTVFDPDGGSLVRSNVEALRHQIVHRRVTMAFRETSLETTASPATVWRGLSDLHPLPGGQMELKQSPLPGPLTVSRARST